MAVLWLRRPLSDDAITDEPGLPSGLALTDFVPERHARKARILLNESYAGGGGQVQGFDDWWQALQGDAEYAADLCFVVEDQNGELAAFAQCWTSAFIKDFAVAPSYRRRGVARRLLTTIARRFAACGHLHLDLKVEAGNTPAVALYRSFGFAPVQILAP
jgi:ribosomal protein S18 acetylase RimI-like enzyme